MRLLRLSVVPLALVAVGAWAQPSTRPAATSSVTVRVSGGVADLSLGDASAFHAAGVESYQNAGVAIPIQREFGTAPVGGLDVLWGTPARRFGVGVRAARSSAYALYGDYAGTLDLVSDARAVFVEAISVAELPAGERVRPFIGSRGGAVYGSVSNREEIDLGEFGASRSMLEGSGIGYSLEWFGGATGGTRRIEVFVQGGYRFAQVPQLTGTLRTDGDPAGEGRLPYGLGLSGWTATAGLDLRL